MQLAHCQLERLLGPFIGAAAPIKPRSAINTDLFADAHHRKKIDSLGDPLAEMQSHIYFAALATEVDRAAPGECAG